MADGKKSDTDSSWCIIPKLPFENVEEQMSVHDAMHIDMACMKRKNLLPVEREIQPMNGAGQSVERKMQSMDKMEQLLDELRRSTAHSIERKGESTCDEEWHRFMQLYQKILGTDKPKVQNSCPNGNQNRQLPVVDDREVIGTLSDVGSEGSSDGFDFIDDYEKIKVVAAEQALSIVPQQTARESIVNTIIQQESLDILRQESVSNNIPEQESIGNDIPQHKSVGNNIPQQKLGDDDARPLKSVDEACFQLQAAVRNIRKKLYMDITYHKKSDNSPCESVNNVVKLEPLNSAVQHDPVTALPINQKLRRQQLPVDNILSCQSVVDSALLQESLNQSEETFNSSVRQKLVSETELEKLKIANKKVIAEVLACMKKFQSSDREAIKRLFCYQKPIGLWAELMDALLPTLGILSLMVLLLHFFIFGCAKPAPNLEASLDLIQSSIVSCFGEQYLMNIKTRHNEFSNSALCVHNVEKYVAIIDEYLDDHVLQFLEAGINNPEDPVFRSFADNHTAIDLQIITKQLQYFALLPDMKGNLTAVETGEAADPQSGNDAMKGTQAIVEFLVHANSLQEHRVASILSKSGPKDDSAAENNEGHAVRTLIKEIESLNKKNAIYMRDIETYYQNVKPVVDRLNLTIKPVLLKNVETHPKDVNNNFVLNLLDEVLTMHNSFSYEYFDIKHRTVRLEHLVNRVEQAFEVNGKGTLLFFLNNISNETSKAFQTIHDSFLCFANYGDAQKTSECLAENLESMLQITYVMLLNLSEFLELILWNTFIFKYFAITYFVILPLTLIVKWCW